MDLVEIGWGSVHWTGVAPDRYSGRALVNAVTNLLVSYINVIPLVRFEISTVFTTKNAIFWNVAPCGSS
jgi:hypothetical protein